MQHYDLRRMSGNVRPKVCPNIAGTWNTSICRGGAARKRPAIALLSVKPTSDNFRTVCLRNRLYSSRVLLSSAHSYGNSLRWASERFSPLTAVISSPPTASSTTHTYAQSFRKSFCSESRTLDSTSTYLRLHQRGKRRFSVTKKFRDEQSAKNDKILPSNDHEAKGFYSGTTPGKAHSPAPPETYTPRQGIATTITNKHLIDRLPNLKQIHRPSKEELLAAATGFWSRLKIRFKWFSIRSARPFNADEIGAFFSWVLVGHVIWIILGTTTFFSLAIFAVNTVFAQGKRTVNRV